MWDFNAVEPQFCVEAVGVATKWALEGWRESMAFELSQFGIGIKTVEPGGMRTDFFTRSLDTARHCAYDGLVNAVMGVVCDPERMASD